jgi:hypothetical protein
MKNTTKTIVAIFTAILFATVANAQVANTTTENFSVKYTGTEEGFICFDVTMPSNANKNVFVRVEDKKEGELFANSFVKTNKGLKFKIEKKNGQEIRFRIYNGNNVFEKTFTANTTLLEATIVDEKIIAVL